MSNRLSRGPQPHQEGTHFGKKYDRKTVSVSAKNLVLWCERPTRWCFILGQKEPPTDKGYK